MFGSHDCGFFGVHDGGSSRFDLDHDGRLDAFETAGRRAYDYDQNKRLNKMSRDDYDLASMYDDGDDW